MFFQTSCSPTSDDEGIFPKHTKRRRHPAGDRRDDDTLSLSSDDCLYNLLTASCENLEGPFNSTEHIPINTEKNNGRFQVFGSTLSSGVFSQPITCGSVDHPTFLSQSCDNVSESPEVWNGLSSRFGNFNIDENKADDSFSDKPTNLETGNNTPPILRWYMNGINENNNGSSDTIRSQSVPVSRFTDWRD